MPRHVWQREHDFFIDEVANADAIGLDQKNFQTFRHAIRSVVIADERDARLHHHRPAHGLHATLANYFGLRADFEIRDGLPDLT